MIIFMVISCEIVQCQLYSYSTNAFYSTVTVTDDCFVNIAESFTIRNFGSNPITQFSRFIKRDDDSNVEVVQRSIQVQSFNNVVNTSLVYNDEFIELQFSLKDPIGRYGGTASIQLSYQMSGPLIVGNIVSCKYFTKYLKILL